MDYPRKGTIGENVECISRLLNCSCDYLCENTNRTVDFETSDGVRTIKELTACKANDDHLPIFDSSELSDPIGEIACYQTLLCYKIRILFEGQLNIFPCHIVYCSYIMHAYCTFCIFSICFCLQLYLYHFIFVLRVRNRCSSSNTHNKRGPRCLYPVHSSVIV